MPRSTLFALLTALLTFGSACSEQQERPGPVVLPADSISFEKDDAAAPTTADTIMARALPGMWRPSPARIATVSYRTYHNRRYGFGFIYPAAVMEPGLPIDGGRGREFVANDGGAVIIAYAVQQANNAMLQEQYHQEMDAQDTRLTYNELHGDSYEISGYKSGQVYYERALLRDGMLKIFRMLYHPEQKEFYDVVAAEASRSFTG